MSEGWSEGWSNATAAYLPSLYLTNLSALAPFPLLALVAGLLA